MRLNKRMSELGLCSRLEADKYIAAGLVTVDGVVVSTLGSKVGEATRCQRSRPVLTQSILVPVYCRSTLSACRCPHGSL